MTYTSGIRKVFTAPKNYGHVSKLIAMAKAADFQAIEHNGSVYIIVKDEAVLTPFTIEDFVASK